MRLTSIPASSSLVPPRAGVAVGGRAGAVALALGGVLGLAACASSGSGGDGDPDASRVDGRPDDLDLADARPGCEPPDMLVVLDRTMTMHRTVEGVTPPNSPEGRASSKWHQVVTALDALLAEPELDLTIRFGLSLFPRDHEGCLLLSQRLDNVPSSNPACEPPELVVPPGIGAGAAIATALDPEATRLCSSTPAGAALASAREELVARRVDGRPQFVVFVTDGADFELTCPAPEHPVPIEEIRRLRAAGIETYVVGFGAQTVDQYGVNPPELNRLACAGGTAPGEAQNCTPGPDSDAVDPNGPRLYIDATNGTELVERLRAVAGSVCCGCVP